MKAFMSCGCMHGFEKPRRPSELKQSEPWVQQLSNGKKAKKYF
jgi:hypothetical protein